MADQLPKMLIFSRIVATPHCAPISWMHTCEPKWFNPRPFKGSCPRLRKLSIKSQRLCLMPPDLENGKRGFPVNIVSIELHPHSPRRYPGTVYLKPVSTRAALLRRFGL